MAGQLLLLEENDATSLVKFPGNLLRVSRDFKEMIAKNFTSIFILFPFFANRFLLLEPHIVIGFTVSPRSPSNVHSLHPFFVAYPFSSSWRMTRNEDGQVRCPFRSLLSCEDLQRSFWDSESMFLKGSRIIARVRLIGLPVNASGKFS